MSGEYTEKPLHVLSTTANESGQQADYSSKANNKTRLSHYLRIFTHSTLADRSFLIAASLAQIGPGTTLPLMNIVFGNLVGSLNEYFIPNSTVTESQFKSSLNRQTLYIVYLFIGRSVLSYFSMLAFRIVGLRMSAKLRLGYLKALFSLPVATLDTLPSGQASNTLTNTANTLQIGISEKFGMILQFTALMFTAVIVAFTYSWKLTLVTSPVIVFIALVYGSVVPVTIKMQKEVEHADQKSSAIAGEVLGSIRMIVGCGAETRFAQKYSGWIQESQRRGFKMSPMTGVQFARLFFAIYATMALRFWFGFILYSEGGIGSVGDILIVLMSVMMLAFAISSTTAPIIVVSKAASAATDFFAVIDAPKPSARGLIAPEVSAAEDILFDSVTFAYPSRPHVKVLDDLNLQVESGKITAIVGASGSGKSTIVGLLERWYELDGEDRYVMPESVIKDEKTDKEKDKETNAESPSVLAVPIKLSCSIRVGGHRLDTVGLKWWRTQIGLVQQEPFIFSDTIYKNVEFGLIGSQ